MKTEPGLVLIVDDEPEIRELLGARLVHAGHEVVTASNGEEALRRIAERLPDAVLLDVVMPGMNGIEVCRRIRGSPTTEHLPILMITALTDRTSRLKAIDAGASDFLTKPFDSEEIMLRVRNAVHMKHLFDQIQENNRRFRQFDELDADLTKMIQDDTRTLSALMGAPGTMGGGAAGANETTRGRADGVAPFRGT
jgi:DNA-binding response OmpR family regulator